MNILKKNKRERDRNIGKRDGVQIENDQESPVSKAW